MYFLFQGGGCLSFFFFIIFSPFLSVPHLRPSLHLRRGRKPGPVSAQLPWDARPAPSPAAMGTAQVMFLLSFCPLSSGRAAGGRTRSRHMGGCSVVPGDAVSALTRSGLLEVWPQSSASVSRMSKWWPWRKPAPLEWSFPGRALVPSQWFLVDAFMWHRWWWFCVCVCVWRDPGAGPQSR